MSASSVFELEFPDLQLEESVQGAVGGLPKPLIFAVLWIFSRRLNSQSVSILCKSAGDSGAQKMRYQAHIDEEQNLAGAMGALRSDRDADLDYQRVPLVLKAVRGDQTQARLLEPGTPQLFVQQLDGNRLRLCWAAGDKPIDSQEIEDFFQKLALVFDHFKTREEEPLKCLSLLTEQAKGLIANPRQAIEVVEFSAVPAVFADVAKRFPEHAAVVHRGRSFTYLQLFACAMKVSRQLRGQGVRLGEPVLVYGTSSFEVVASVLGVLDAGGVLVTLDPALPTHRLQQIVELSDSRFVVMCPAAAEPAAQLLDILPAHRLKLDASFYAHGADSPTLTDDPGPALPLNASAYLFFTSGSTGTPKGVLGTHQGLAHFLDWQRTNFPLKPGDRSAQITALSFDVVLRDILYPLTSGACIYIPERGQILEPEKILPWFFESQISILHCVPSLMKAWLLLAPELRPFSFLKYAFFAGEPLTSSLINSFREYSSSSTQVVNLYGPTETTLAKLCQVVDQPVEGVQPIGKAQPAVDVLIVRDRKFLCGVYEVGEILIRTPHRSKGYYKNDVLTREVFIPNPWSDDPQDLLYCTGDLGLILPDGRIHIMGRIDNQIKIRGVRIEPHEIEAQILKNPDMASAVVLARADDAGEKVLCAFVVPRAGVDPASSHGLEQQIRHFLKGALPDAMVPRRIFAVGALPYLPNGKVDRRALLAMQDLSTAKRNQTPWAFGAEPELLAIVDEFEKALGVRVARVDQSFVDLGGDSLSFIRLSLALQKLKGKLPDAWEKLSVQAISRLNKTERTAWTPVAVSIPIRFVAIILIVLGHINPDLHVLSPAISLLLVSGFAFATFQVNSISKTGRVSGIVDFIVKIWVPSALVLLVVQHDTADFYWSPVFLVANIALPKSQFGDYWYIFVLVQIYVVMLVLFSFKPLRALFLKHEFHTSLALLLICLGMAAAYDGEAYRFDVVQNKLWLFCFGMCIAYARTLPQRWSMLAIALLTFIVVPKLKQYFPFIPSERLLSDLFVGDGLALVAFVVAAALIFFKQVQLPTVFEKLVFFVASSTLFIYLTHFSLRHLVRKFPAVDLNHLGHDFLFLCVALLLGVVCWWVYEWCLALVRQAFSGAKGGRTSSGAVL